MISPNGTATIYPIIKGAIPGRTSITLGTARTLEAQFNFEDATEVRRVAGSDIDITLRFYFDTRYTATITDHVLFNGSRYEVVAVMPRYANFGVIDHYECVCTDDTRPIEGL